MSKMDKSTETEYRLCGCQGLGKMGNGEWLLNGMGFVFRMMKMFGNEIVVMVA